MLRSVALVFVTAVACRETQAHEHPIAKPARAVTTELPRWKALGPGVSEHRTERRDSTGASLTWIVVRMDLTRAAVRAEHAEGDRLDALAKVPGAVFAVNGGFFDPDTTPTGLIVRDGRVASPWHRGGGSGILVIRGTTASVVATPPDSFDGVSLAVQCGPRLVEPGGVNGMHGDDGKRAARTVACVRAGGRELDMVLAYDASTPMGGPTLFQTAKWLVEPLADGDSTSCEAALNLDGGPSTGFVSPAIPETEWKRPLGPVPWGLVAVSPR